MKQFNFLFSLVLLYLFSSQLNAQSLDFDGVDDFVNMPDATQYITSGIFGDTDITLSAWIKPEQTGAHQHICGIRNGGANDFYFHQRNDNQIEARFINSSGTIFNINYSPGLNQGVWNHLVMTYDGSALRLYHNTIQVAVTGATGGISDDGGYFNMGAWNNNQFFFQGELDEVSLWDDAVSPAEIQALYYKSPDTSDSDLQLYYKFNQGTPNGNNTGITSLTDTQGNQNGALSNFSLSGTSSNWVDEYDLNLVVTNTNDSGNGSLRDAIIYANNTAGGQTIEFNIPGAGPHTITTTNTTNYIINDDNTIIDGTTQPGYTDTPLIILDGNNGQPDCFSLYSNGNEIYGLNIKNNSYAGINIRTNSNTNIIGAPNKGNIITNFGSGGLLGSAGIYLVDNCDNNIIQYNKIGIDENGAGTTITSSCISLQTGSDNNIIEYNTIGSGTVSITAPLIHLEGNSNGNRISYNNIGTDENEGDFGAVEGMDISSSNNIIDRNTIANNGIGIDDNGQYNDIYLNDYICNSTTAMESNGNVSPPIILEAKESIISGTATYNASNSTFLFIHIQNNDACSSAPCQGEYFKTAYVQPDGTWSYTPATPLTPGDFITVQLNINMGSGYESSALSSCTEVACDLAAPGDSLSTAIVIPSLPFTTMDSTSNPCLSDNFVFVNAGNDDIYYQFTPSVCATSVTISLSNIAMDYYILDAGGTVITYENGGTTSLTTDELIGDEIYYLVVEAFQPSSEDTYTLNITETLIDGSTGNDISSAIILTEGININNTSCGYTNTIGNVTPDVFYQFTTGSCTDSIIISTCEGTSFNTLIRLLDENGTQIDINYNACGLQSEIIRTDLEPNTTYYAVVEGQNGESGLFSLNYRETKLAENISNGPNGALGNTIENPFIVPSLPFSANGNTDNCLSSATLNNPGDEGASYVDHFYQFTTNACPSEYTISTCGLTDFDTYIFLKDAAGSVIAENNNACGTSSIITRSDLSPNTTYLVEVEGLNPSDIGNYNLSISSVATGPNTIVYVDQSASGNNDGSTWTDAYTDLQDALINMTDCGNEIWIANGTYYTAAPGSGRAATFNLNKNVVIYGGFAGGETDLASRDITNNIAELSGDIDDDGTSANNSFHTVKVDNATVILDGLTIKDGAADQTPFARARGGGLFVKESNLTLENCSIKDNVALFGGALFATLSDVTINGSTISNNEANNGAALYHSNENNMYINDTRIVDNNSIIRCAIEVNNSNYTKIVNSVIANNTAANANAIGIISTNRNVQCDIYSSTIIGGTKNRALITLQVGYGDQLDMNVYNSIVAHQNANFNKNFVAFNNNVLNLNTANCYIQGTSVIGTATDNLYSATAGDLLLATDGSYALQPCSPAVDAGSTNYPLTSFDIVGNNRYLFTNTDMGAYESTEECILSKEISEDFLDIQDVEPEFLIYNIYPNPAADILNVSFEASGERDIHISITDLTGKLIMNQTIKSTGGEQVETLDVSGLTAGYYMVNLQNDGERISQKFVKM